jgi:Domain of unknown function (DUF6468)
MSAMEWILDFALVILLTATLFHAVRLERALGVLKRDRVALETLVESFNASTHAAESGVEHLRAATDGAGRQIQRQIDIATALKDDLTFMVQRGEGLADRLDELVRATRPTLAIAEQSSTRGAGVSQGMSQGMPQGIPRVVAGGREEPKVRSQAERDLLKALRMVK